MKFVIFLVAAFVCAVGGQYIIYPKCRCCDWWSENQAVQSLIKWFNSYQTCSPDNYCVGQCMYKYNTSIYIRQPQFCSVQLEPMVELYRWLVMNYQCLPQSLLNCVKKCVINFERYPSCYWTINSEYEIGIATN